MSFLEIENGIIVGIHTDEGTDPNATYVEFDETDNPVNPGDSWDGTNVIPFVPPIDLIEDNRKLARAHIVSFYPEWDQLNILRVNDAIIIAKMGTFIDACRDWSNGADPDEAVLTAIVP